MGGQGDLIMINSIRRCNTSEMSFTLISSRGTDTLRNKTLVAGEWAHQKRYMHAGTSFLFTELRNSLESQEKQPCKKPSSA
jgi:hypothetical protein